MYKKIIFEAKQLYYNDIIKSHINDLKMTWKIINELTGNKRNKQSIKKITHQGKTEK